MMRAILRIKRHLRVYSYQTTIRYTSSTKKKPDDLEVKEIIKVYTQKWEPRILNLKEAMKTDINDNNVHHFDKCHDQINELNHGLKRFCKSIASSRNKNVETLTQNINNLHQQLQDKTKSNQTLKDEIDNLQQELQTNEESIDELKANTNKLNVTLKKITNDRDGLNTKLHENETLIQDLRQTNDSIHKQLEDMQSELKIMEQQLIETKEKQIQREKVMRDEYEYTESDEINKTKGNMAKLLRDLIDLENQYNKLKMVCIGLGSVLLIGLFDVYRTRKKLKQTRLKIEQMQENINNMFYFKR